jgi:D-alanyl-D-alanine carboxypeptidase
MLLVLLVLVVGALNCGSAGADAIDDYLLEVERKLKIPGMVLAVLEDGRISVLRTRGYASLEYDVPTEAGTVFELASLTKQFTAAAIMALVQAAKLELDDKLVDRLPERFRDAPLNHWQAITIRHLLTHTSGLPNRFEWRPVAADGEKIWLLNYDTEDLFQAAAQVKLVSEPGDTFRYSDAGYFLLGLVIEEASGGSYRNFLARTFFDKVGMRSTDIGDPRRVIEDLADAYAWDEGACDLGRDRLRDVREELTPHYGAISSALDLAKWEAELNDPTILTETSLEQMWSPTTLNGGQPVDYGFGWMVGRLGEHEIVDHSGITGTYYVRVPEERLALILLTNRSWLRHDLLREIGAEVIDRYKAEQGDATWSHTATEALARDATRCRP